MGRAIPRVGCALERRPDFGKDDHKPGRLQRARSLECAVVRVEDVAGVDLHRYGSVFEKGLQEEGSD
jgi:hypothetical protein